ncbi:His Kinase A (phospho-acceptor) domain-containing protein [Chitinophaga sp. CF118]|uniref:sensor histidine kinase n=1 Tax=Chitinophaga sp. CF118 TaxID=1884367 RepID=UPI0008F2E969|nr:response regulator [Chitinophaga sp. CF118]SFD27209.1 His Kinase A (phospho-acceptor) domain-containing protein [Chitinophaga sp. CF118]
MQDQDLIKILVVDDREDNLLSIESILERESYIIVKANSGRAALKILLKEYDFSLILMDVQMPDMNGFETAALIYQRDKLKDVPIIFITAHNEDEAIFRGYKVGAVDFIYKPVNPELLRIKVGLFVELYRKTKSLIVQEQKLLNANASLQREIEEKEASELKVRELNRQLIQNNIHLKTVNEELDRFAYIASHDLQEPLRKIRVFSDMIIQKKTGPAEEVDKYVMKITNATIRMQQLVSGLLRFSRHSIQGGDFEAVDLTEIVREAITELEIKIQQTNARITIDPLPAVFVIPLLMRQVFYNLISNALKFRKKEVSPEIHIYSQQEEHREATGSTYYRIFIKDNGIGFENQYSDDIFVVFKRLHSYHEIEGTGIGLSICKKIMEQHNGSITAISEIDNGATFIVGIPEKQQVRLGNHFTF